MNSWHSQNNQTRKAGFAGKFYPGTKYELSQELFSLFDGAKMRNETLRRIRALIVPHAGYIFSGKVAASVYKQIPESTEFKHVFVIASSHWYHFHGAAVFRENYETPLGKIHVDAGIADQLMSGSPLFLLNDEAHREEHSLEVQLPFLQHVLGTNFKLVPIILGTSSSEECKQIAEALTPWFTPDNLFIISTDFSHYPDYLAASKVDFLTAEAICKNQPDELLGVLEENKAMNIKNLATSLCGWTSVLTLLWLTANQNLVFTKIEYQNSGDSKFFGDQKRVVGYWGIAVSENENQFSLSEEEKDELLVKARAAIIDFLNTVEKGKVVPSAFPALNEVAGAFVSIYVGGQLRGCIGGFAREKPLNEMVQVMAVSAARDHRFESLELSETETMKLEISVLSPLKKISSPGEIELGKHGIYIKKDFNSGTFLPQVAIKTGWNVHEFLGHCARDKAGIGWNGWKDAELYTYEALVFGE
jgi:AmmeMemoRadiSam system protein B/AmmeMemoRadiSam system protein A